VTTSAPQPRRPTATATPLTQRDIDGLVFTAQMYGVQLDQLAALLQLTTERARTVAARWRGRGYAESARLGPGPAWLWLTRAGLTACGLPYTSVPPGLSRLAHLRAVTAIRLAMQGSPTYITAAARWRSERHLRARIGRVGAAEHIPDGEVHWPDTAADPAAALPSGPPAGPMAGKPAAVAGPQVNPMTGTAGPMAGPGVSPTAGPIPGAAGQRARPMTGAQVNPMAGAAGSIPAVAPAGHSASAVAVPYAGECWAIEAELTAKTVRRTVSIMIELLSRTGDYGCPAGQRLVPGAQPWHTRALYLCAPAARATVLRARAALGPELAARIEIRDLPPGARM
jgi:hypothetical protein